MGYVHAGERPNRGRAHVVDPTFIDFEARSKCDLKKLGGRNYAAHETTEVLCCAYWRPEDSGPILWTPDEPTPDFGEDEICAHNWIGFDRHVWAELGWPMPKKWQDTAQLARMAGYPVASLDALAWRLLYRRKDLEGSKLTKALSAVVPKSTKTGLVKGDYRIKEIPAHTLERVGSYCLQDVRDLKGIWPYLSLYTDFEPEVREVDRIILDRGVTFDRELAEIVRAASELMAQEAQEAAGVDAALCRSRPKFLAELASLGLDLPNAQKATLEAVLEDLGEGPDYAPIVALIEARLGTATIAASKLTAGLNYCGADGQLRDQSQVYGAHTWRWAGRVMQLQNLAK